MAEEALEFHIEGMLEDGEDIPVPSALDDIMADPENRDGVAVLVPVPDLAEKTERINITIPSNVLTKLDRYVDKTPNANRSQVLTEAVKKYVKLKSASPRLKKNYSSSTGETWVEKDTDKEGYSHGKAASVNVSHSRSKRGKFTKTPGGKHFGTKTTHK